MPFHDGSASFFTQENALKKCNFYSELHFFSAFSCASFLLSSFFTLFPSIFTTQAFMCCSVAVLQFQNDSRKSTLN